MRELTQSRFDFNLIFELFFSHFCIKDVLYLAAKISELSRENCMLVRQYYGDIEKACAREIKETLTPLYWHIDSLRKVMHLVNDKVSFRDIYCRLPHSFLSSKEMHRSHRALKWAMTESPQQISSIAQQDDKDASISLTDLLEPDVFDRRPFYWLIQNVSFEIFQKQAKLGRWAQFIQEHEQNVLVAAVLCQDFQLLEIALTQLQLRNALRISCGKQLRSEIVMPLVEAAYIQDEKALRMLINALQRENNDHTLRALRENLFNYFVRRDHLEVLQWLAPIMKPTEKEIFSMCDEAIKAAREKKENPIGCSYTFLWMLFAFPDLISSSALVEKLIVEEDNSLLKQLLEFVASRRPKHLKNILSPSPEKFYGFKRHFKKLEIFSLYYAADTRIESSLPKAARDWPFYRNLFFLRTDYRTLKCHIENAFVDQNFFNLLKDEKQKDNEYFSFVKKAKGDGYLINALSLRKQIGIILSWLLVLGELPPISPSQQFKYNLFFPWADSSRLSLKQWLMIGDFFCVHEITPYYEISNAFNVNFFLGLAMAKNMPPHLLEDLISRANDDTLKAIITLMLSRKAALSGEIGSHYESFALLQIYLLICCKPELCANLQELWILEKEQLRPQIAEDLSQIIAGKPITFFLAAEPQKGAAGNFYQRAFASKTARDLLKEKESKETEEKAEEKDQSLLTKGSAISMPLPISEPKKAEESDPACKVS